MSERILTLFGEEIIPEQPKAPPKPRAKKKQEEKVHEEIKGENARPEIQTENIVIPEAVEQQIDKEPEKHVEEEKTFVLPEDWKGDKNYYTIGEVAELFKVKTSHIRFWTNEFKLKVRTTRKGDRMYTPDQVRELRAINHLVKERGFTLSGAKAKMKEQNNKDVETVDLKQSLQQLRAKLVIIKNQLT